MCVSYTWKIKPTVGIDLLFVYIIIYLINIVEKMVKLEQHNTVTSHINKCVYIRTLLGQLSSCSELELLEQVDATLKTNVGCCLKILC